MIKICLVVSAVCIYANVKEALCITHFTFTCMGFWDLFRGASPIPMVFGFKLEYSIESKTTH
jgi:hypothetical protein